MKYSLVFLLFCGLTARTQETVTYYDFFWKPCKANEAIFAAVVTKTDSGWLRNDYYVSSKRLQMSALYEDADCKIANGVQQYYHANGRPSTLGTMIHGKREGICLSFHSNGMMADSAMYKDGKEVGLRLRWWDNGFLSDSIARINDSLQVKVQWFEDGNISAAGRLLNGEAEGKWQYFHHNGKVAAVETYHKGERLQAEYFTEAGQPLSDTSQVNHEAEFKGGITAWKKYLEKYLTWPSNLEFTTAGSVTVGVSFVLDENGKVTEPEVYLPFHQEFDAIALKIIRNSPAWIPKISHNRKVKAYFRQPITFNQPEE